MKIRSSILLLVILLIGINLKAQTPAFPTAEGYGMWATGGRGGKVVEVTSLEAFDRRGSAVEGGLLWAFQQHEGEPITIVFKVSGIIDLNGNDVRVKRSNMTIAGQTAPGDGICIKGGKLNLGGSTNLIIRHLRFRLGLKSDGSFIEGAALGLENGSNFIIDHCTFGWSGEENMTIYDDNDLTIQWCIVHEGLYDVGHPKGVRSYGSQWGGQTATYHHNLLANNVSRTPRVNGARSNDHNVLIDYVNNVNYNWGKSNSAYGADFDASGVSHHANWINNYYKPGPARSGTSSSYFVQSSFHSEQDTSKVAVWYMSGNYMGGTANTDKNTDNYVGLDASYYTNKGVDKSKLMAAEAFTVPYALNIETAEEAYNSVTTGAGAFPRDAVDKRIVNDVLNGTASGGGSYGENKGIIDHPDEVGGYPEYISYNIIADVDHDGIGDYWEAANGLDSTNAADASAYTTAGYTYLEAYLNGIVGEKLSGINYPDPQYTDAKVLATPKIEGFIAYVDYNGNTLNLKSDEAIEQIIVYDLNGKIILNEQGDRIATVNIEILRSGLYLLQAKSKEKLITTRFIK